MSKEELAKRIKRLSILNRVFFYLSLGFLLISLSMDIVAFILTPKYGYESLVVELLLELSAVFFAGSVALFFVRIFAIGTKLRNSFMQLATFERPQSVVNEKVDLGTTDVKPAPVVKTHEQELVEQYENLLKQGYITQEEFDAKKKEILG